MNKPFDTLFHFHKSPVIRETDNTPRDFFTNGVFFGYLAPRIRSQLFNTQRNPLLLPVKIQHLDFDFIADPLHFGGVPHTTPGHIRNVNKAVYPAQINKEPVIGDVFHHPFQHNPFLNDFKRFLLKGGTFRFQYGTTGQNDITPPFIVFYNFKFMIRVHQTVHIPDRSEIHLGPGQKSLKPNIHRQPTLNP